MGTVNTKDRKYPSRVKKYPPPGLPQDIVITYNVSVADMNGTERET